MNLFRAVGHLLVLLAVPAMAQLDTGTITGRVTDPTGAVIAGAQVLVVRTDTNFEYPTQTNNEGLYRVQALRPGPYRVEVSASGFKK
ncbi:MAG: carboxypeptidase-like regulatory domain-containing protein [Bryobacteraceae bacterium]